MFVKICGITRVEDARLAVALGASAVGFVFWQGSPRPIDPERARTIVDELPARVLPVGVFVNAEPATVEHVVRVARVRAVQLHGEEPAAYCARLTLPVIKAVRLGPGRDSQQALAVPASCTVLVDSFHPRERGGTGRVADWVQARQVARARPVVLAGGLHADNVAAAIRTVRPWGVDVSSGVESAPGVKDAARMRHFFAALGTVLEELEP